MIGPTLMAVTSRALRTVDELRRLLPEWAELLERCPTATPFQRPEWLLPWIEAFLPREIAAIEIRHEGALAGLAPLLIYTRETQAREAQHVLAFMGGGVSDYLDVLVDPGHESLLLQELFRRIHELPGWDVLDLTDLPSNSMLARSAVAHNITPHDACSSLSLQSGEEVSHLFSRRQRANLRNARSRLQKAGGGKLEIATLGTLPEFLEDLFRLHTTRWSSSGRPGVLNDESIRHFHRLSAPQLLKAEILRLYRLRSGDRTLAVIYSLFERDTVFCYLQGFDPEYAYFSPGTQLMFMVIEDAVRHGMQKFDFLRGDEAYKQHWRARKEPTFRLQITRREL